MNRWPKYPWDLGIEPDQPEPYETREAQILKLVSDQSFRTNVPVEEVDDYTKRRTVTYLLGLEESHKVVKQMVEVRGSVAVDRRVEKSWSDRHLPTFKRLLKKSVAPDFERVEVPVNGTATFEVDIDMKAFFPEWTNEMGLVLYEEITRSRFIHWDERFRII